MDGYGETRRLEQGLTYVRGFGVLFGIAAVATTPDFPNETTQQAAWVTVAAIAIINAAIWGVLGRVDNQRQLRMLSQIAFLFDAAIVFTFIWLFAYEDPYVTWALALFLPMEGALRYRLKGALFATLIVAIFFVPQTLRVAEVTGGAVEWSTYVFVVGLTGLVAGVVGSMAENWYEQRETLAEQSLKLAEVDALKDRFLAITSHEIRGPLTAIIAGVETLQTRADKLSPEQSARLLEMVGLQGHQLARMVDDLLVTAQVQGGSPALHPEWTTLSTVVDQALTAASPKRRQHNLELFIDPIECEIDAARVSQIIRNLVENAYKYTPERTPVAVTGRKTSRGITLSVADSGTGIPRDKRAQLFEAFSRIEETSAGQDGVGLGLYVVSQLVAAMGGRIDLSSASDGTTFSIHLPCQARDAAPQLGLVRSDEGTA